MPLYNKLDEILAFADEEEGTDNLETEDEKEEDETKDESDEDLEEEKVEEY